jgi:hypothetical protein
VEDPRDPVRLGQQGAVHKTRNMEMDISSRGHFA